MGRRRARQGVKERGVRERGAFTLIEMLTTVAALVILLGLMVSLARHVRNRSARVLTQRVLVALEHVMAQYEHDHHILPPAPALMEAASDSPTEAGLQRAAAKNNAGFFEVLLREPGGARAFRDLPPSLYDDTGVRDAWGTPIVFMRPGAVNVGMSPQNRYFFFSAGADRKFVTLEDNLYSYEAAGAHE